MGSDDKINILITMRV